MKTALLLLLALPASAEVREIQSMSEIVPSVSTATLLVFDIDNTLVEPTGNAGSDQWYYYLEKAYRRDGLSQEAAEEKAGKTWARSLDIVKAKAVEALSPALVRSQQERGVKVMALTARDPQNSLSTRRQLKASGYDLVARTVREESVYLVKAELNSSQDGLYDNGVLYVGDGPDKGKALIGFLKKIGYAAEHVVFVDDKPHHAKNVDAALRAAGIKSTAFRYGAADAKVKAFNEVMAEADSRASADLLFHGRIAD